MKLVIAGNSFSDVVAEGENALKYLRSQRNILDSEFQKAISEGDEEKAANISAKIGRIEERIKAIEKMLDEVFYYMYMILNRARCFISEAVLFFEGKATRESVDLNYISFHRDVVFGGRALKSLNASYFYQAVEISNLFFRRAIRDATQKEQDVLVDELKNARDIFNDAANTASRLSIGSSKLETFLIEVSCDDMEVV